MTNLVLEIIEGPNKGQRFPINHGDKIGNGSGEAKTEIKLPAKNISTLHAKIVGDEKSQLVLIALNPSRAFYVNSQNLNKVTLVPGLVFKMEEMLIRVLSQDQIELQTELIVQTQALLTRQIEYPSNETYRIKTKPLSPREVLENLLTSCIPFIPRTQEEGYIKAFKNPLQMRFTQGIQFEDSFVLGWGPRRFGKNTLEFSLSEPIAPDIAFTISPGPQGEYEFSTPYSNIVFINGQKLKKALVKSGDKIKIGDTIIELLELEYF